MVFIKLIWAFLKIGCFGFGGGYAMLSLIRDEVVVQNNWMTNQEFVDLVAISQTTPGPIGINSATYSGYKALENLGYHPGICVLGAVLATLAICLPSFVLILFISYYFLRFKSNRYFSFALAGIRPLSVALIAMAALSLMNTENFSDYGSGLIFCAALLLSIKYRWHPILLLALAAAVGLVVY
ncbi:chromate transporter [Flavobacterium sp. JP2137]|uniref:chromate transporter n=1 Tax=Flavobacterium sp. JP2137 TaxID=3414510 RepID=UPI003D2FB391